LLMAVKIKCPNCEKTYRVEGETGGRRIQFTCKKCGQTSTVAMTTDETIAGKTPPPLPAAPVKGSPIPSKIGRYQIKRRLGGGGMAEVWLGHDPNLKRDAAIKTLRPEHAQDPQYRDRFLREARVAAQLHHTNTVTIYEVDTDGELAYIAMELVDGSSLDRVVSKMGRMAWREATRVIRDAATGVAVAHEAGLVHRDIKPANLIRTSKGVTKVADFGLARAQVSNTQMTQQGILLGTPAYMAPERWGGQEADARSDIYALTCAYYYLLTGRAPYDASEFPALGYQHRYEPLPDPRHWATDLPDKVCQILLHGLAKDPAQRYQTTAELEADLAKTLADDEKIVSVHSTWVDLGGISVPNASPTSRARSKVKAGIMQRLAGVMSKTQSWLTSGGRRLRTPWGIALLVLGCCCLTLLFGAVYSAMDRGLTKNPPNATVVNSGKGNQNHAVSQNEPPDSTHDPRNTSNRSENKEPQHSNPSALSTTNDGKTTSLTDEGKGTGTTGPSQTSTASIPPIPPPVKNWRPTYVFSLSSYQDLSQDLDRLSGKDDVLRLIRQTPLPESEFDESAKWLLGMLASDGVNTTKPWGLIQETDGSQTREYCFVPTIDLPKFLASCESSVGKPTNLGQGIFEIALPSGGHSYIQQQGNWAFICDKPEYLADMPSNPVTKLKGWNDRYRLALACSVCELSAKERQAFVDGFRQGFESSIERIPGESDEDQAKRRAQQGKAVEDQLKRWIDQMDTAVLGWGETTLPRNAIGIDICFTAKARTELADLFARNRSIESEFGNFEVPNSAMTAGCLMSLGPEEVKFQLSNLEEFRKAAHDNLEKSLSQAELAQAKEAIDMVANALKGMIQDGRIDGRLAISVQPKFTVLAAARAKNADDFKTVFNTFREMGGNAIVSKGNFAGGYSYEVITAPKPLDGPDRDVFAQLFGDKLQIVLATGNGKAYFALGKDAVGTLGSIINKPRKSVQSPLFEVNFRLAKLMNFLANMAPDENKQILTQVAKLLQMKSGSDGISFTVNMIENGCRLRLKCDEGVVDLIKAQANGEL
jgi:serine/threonine protein kinase